MNYKYQNLIYLHLAVLLFGAAGLFAKFIPLPATVLVLGRVVFASLFLFGFIIINKQPLRLNSSSDYFKLVMLGLLLAFHWFAFFQSIIVSSVAVGLITFSTFPVFTVILEPMLSNERFFVKNLTASFVVLLGVLLVVPEYNFNNNIFQGAVWGVSSGMSFALLSIFNKKLVVKYSGSLVAFYQDLFAAIILMPFFFIEKPVIDITTISLLILLGVLFTGVAHTLFIKSLSTIKAQTASIIVSLEPVYGILLALVLLNEIPEVRVVVGGVIILFVVFYISIRK